ncbi:hypothetical protein KR074_007257, partial [Drosophila pseudoananassae]
SLMMSDDSENEDVTLLQSRKISPKARRQRMLDSDEDDDPTSVENKEEEVASKPYPENLMDSVEDSTKLEREQEILSSKPKKKISSIVDTDSEEEPEKEQPKPSKKDKKTKTSKKMKQRFDSEEGSHKEEESESKPPKKEKNKKLEKKRKQRMESESEEEIKKPQSKEESSPPKNKLKGLVDSESEPELSNPEEEAEREPETPTEEMSKKPKKAKEMRASAKKALDGMQAIQSEQQRLHREAHINVPYHQPKPRTLKEFLSRRTVNAPLATALAGGSPMPNKQSRKSLGLRMTREELEAYAKLMDARAKEATEFFKSESEPEEDEEDEAENEEPVEMKDNPGVLDEGPMITPEAEEPKDPAVEPPSENVIEEVPMEDEPIASTSASAALKLAEVTETLEKSPIKSPNKVCLVTEVVELPKLDLSTISITPPSKPATPKISEAIRKLKIEKSSDVSPSLKGDTNMVIDLETGDMFAKKPTGVDDLLQRLMKTREAKKHKTTETVNILTTQHGKLEMSKVNYHHHDEEPVNKEPKPGAAYIKMQEQLKSLIAKKRVEELKKKQAEEQEKMAEDEEEMDVDEEYEPEDKPGHAEVTINDDEEIVDREGIDNEEETEEVDGAEENKSEAEEDPEEESEKEEESSESDQESEPEPETQTGRKKNRIIKAFVDDNSDEDDLDLLQTPKPSGAPPLTATQLQLSAQKLFDEEARKTASDEENELLDLCSGQFPQSQMVSSAAPSSIDNALISQIPLTPLDGSSQAPDELEGLCSGTFATQLPGPTQTEEDTVDSQPLAPVATKIVSSDEDEPKEELPTSEKPRSKKLTKKRQKKAKLGFSDDEESEDEVVGEELGEESDEEPAEEIPETFVDYDSEENEIVVEMTKKDRKLRASNFVEKEAELSESEWGSADEDEKNMDTYDIELGDEDQFDREQLRNELGQIHARKMLDQDIREVRKIKEMLIEDEEGAVRQRQFRWRNAENGFSLDDQRPEDGEANEGSGDEENEHLWRKIRYEREQLLLEKGLKPEAASPLSTSTINTSSPVNTIRRLNIITSKKTSVEVKKSSPFLISKTVSGKQQKGPVRGSFLIRDQETLSKLAGLTKGSSGEATGDTATLSVKTAKAKNFVFATLTEEEHENQKRKAADLLNSSSETGVNFMKKPRLEPRREKCLIDQLL